MRFKKCSNVDELLERHKYQKSSRRTVNLDRSVPTNGTEFVFKYLLTKKTTGGPEALLVNSPEKHVSKTHPVPHRLS